MTTTPPPPERREQNLGPAARRERTPGPVKRRREDPATNGAARLVSDASLPLWARMTALVGVPGTIAVFLVYSGAQALPALQSQLALARQSVESEITALRLENQRLGQLISLNQARTEENHRLLVRICAAVTEGTERASCFDP